MQRIAALAVLVVSLAAATVAPATGRARAPITYARGSSAPTFVHAISDGSFGRTPVRAALRYLAERSDRYRIANPHDTLEPIDVHEHAGGADVRFAQTYRGLPVWGAQYVVHLAERDGGYAPRVVNGHYFTELDVPTEPRFGIAAAVTLARARLYTFSNVRLHRHGLTVLPFGRGVLAYHLTAEGERMGHAVAQELFVNARTGTTALTFNNLQHDGPVPATGRTSHGETVSFGAYERAAKFELRDQSKPMFATFGGEIATHNAKRTANYLGTPSNIVTSSTAFFDGSATTSGGVNAHYGAGRVYDFFRELGRESLDGAGMDIVSTVNATEPGRVPMYNAFWDGVNEQMVYGNPDPQNLHPFSAALDVVGHELTHGVTQHSGNLAYLGQSGAMNEAYSDYFGNAIEVVETGMPMDDPEAGFIGEDLCKGSGGGPFSFPCPLRDLNDGTTTSDYIYFLADLDNGGVHLNSTIFGGALWDVREALGADADRYIYRALEGYTTPLDTFIDGRNSILAAAGDLAAPQAHLDAIAAAFDAHGIVTGWDASVANDATILMPNVAPISDVGMSPPQVDGKRFVIADYADKADMCCVGLQVFTGTTDGGSVTKASAPTASSRLTDETPDVSGDRMVWTRIRLRNASALSGSIIGRRVGGNESTIARGGLFVNPSIDGNLVAWQSIGRNSDIQARYLGRRIRVVTDERGDQMFPQVAGDWVAWWDARESRLGVKNLATGKKRTVRPDDRFAFVGPPALTKRYLFWFEIGAFDDRGSILRMDLRTGKRKTVVRSSSRDAPVWALVFTAPPVVSANADYFVYSTEAKYAEEFGGRPAADKSVVGRDIFIVPIAGGDPKPVTSNRADQAYPLLGLGRTVVWLDSSEARTDLVTRTVP